MKIQFGPNKEDFIQYNSDSLTLYGSRYNIDSLPGGLTIRGSLDLSHYTSLTSLPENLTVIGNLYIENCVSLKILPPTLKVSRSIFANACVSLQTISIEAARFCDNIHVSKCLSLVNRRNEPSAVYSNVEYHSEHNSINMIVGILDEDALAWCKENEIVISFKTIAVNGSCPVTCPVINDPVQLALYRLRWD